VVNGVPRLTAMTALLLSLLGSPSPRTIGGSGGWSLVVLVDLSVSMQLGQAESDIVLDALRNGLLNLLTAQERVRIGAFASGVRFFRTGDDPMAVLNTLQTALQDRTAWRDGPSRLWDAVDDASALIASDPGRRVVLVLSDGEASGNALGRVRVAANLRSRGASLWAIAVRPGFGDDRLREFIIKNGGQVFVSHLGRQDDSKKPALATAFSQVLVALRGASSRPEHRSAAIR
jgi:hypothetical protein